MGLLVTILVGLISGLVASWLMKAKTGVFVDLILGIVGAVLGGWITSPASTSQVFLCQSQERSWSS
jgi:uncharacterized membrane protein YeaQ/YmgE (transglycosylase-associated protein family)